MTKFAVGTASIPMTQQSSHVEITNEGNAYHFLQYQGYCSLSFYSTRPNSQLSLLCGNIEAVM
jgi:hypothetical protein